MSGDLAPFWKSVMSKAEEQSARERNVIEAAPITLSIATPIPADRVEQAIAMIRDLDKLEDATAILRVLS